MLQNIALKVRKTKDSKIMQYIIEWTIQITQYRNRAILKIRWYESCARKRIETKNKSTKYVTILRLPLYN